LFNNLEGKYAVGYFENSEITFHSVQILNNSATTSSVVSFVSSAVSISKTNVSSNSAEVAVLALTLSTCQIHNCTFLDNYSLNYGVLYVLLSPQVRITSSLFQTNSGNSTSVMTATQSAISFDQTLLVRNSGFQASVQLTFSEVLFEAS
jgi:hypothetical protein